MMDPHESLAHIEQVIKHKDPRLGYSFMIFDYNMPVINGPSLLRKVKRLYKKYKIPDEELPTFVLITGQEGEGDLDQAQRDMFDEVMMKPASFATLTALFRAKEVIA